MARPIIRPSALAPPGPWMPTPVELNADGVMAPQIVVSNALVAPQHVAQHVAVAQAPVEVAPVAEPALAPQPPQVQPSAVSVLARSAVALTDAQPTATHSVAAAATAATPEDALIKQAYRALNSGNTHDALANARRALNTAPTRADAWLVVGSAYGAMQDRASAQQAFRACALRAKGPFVNECRKLARD